MRAGCRSVDSLRLTALAGMVLSGVLALLVDSWGLDWRPTLRMDRVACFVGADGLRLIKDGSLLGGEGFTSKANILLMHSSIDGLATAEVHHC